MPRSSVSPPIECHLAEVEFPLSPHLSSYRRRSSDLVASSSEPMPRVGSSPTHTRHTPSGPVAAESETGSRPKACKRCHTRKRKVCSFCST